MPKDTYEYWFALEPLKHLVGTRVRVYTFARCVCSHAVVRVCVCVLLRVCVRVRLFGVCGFVYMRLRTHPHWMISIDYLSVLTLCRS